MKRLAALLWQKTASINLTIVLCLLLTADLLWGYFCLNRHTRLFSPLGDLGLFSWLNTYGQYNLGLTLWFFFLLFLLALLAANTFCCTTNRVLQLLRSRHRAGILLRLAPHCMHYALLLILAGYLVSYLFSHVLPSRPLVPGSHLSLPGTGGQVTLLAIQSEYYEGERLSRFQGRVLKPKVLLELNDGEQRRQVQLTDLTPVFFQGTSIHLQDYSPRSKGGMRVNKWASLHLRRDPGLWCSCSGMALFVLGLFLYLYDWFIHREATS